MTASGWRYIATRMNGDGTETPLATDLPLVGSRLTNTLSGPDDLVGSIPVDVARLHASSSPYGLFLPWSTAIYAECDGVIRNGTILTDVLVDDHTLKLTGTGFTGYLSGLPFTDELNLVRVDPLVVARTIWDSVQAQPGSNLGLVLDIDPSASPIRLGNVPVDHWPTYTDGKKGPTGGVVPGGSWFKFNYTVVDARKNTNTVTAYGETSSVYSAPNGDQRCIFRRVSDGVLMRDKDGTGVPSGYVMFGVASDTQPSNADDGQPFDTFKLDWYADVDLAPRWDALARDGHFDYWVEHAWDGDQIAHTLHINYGGSGRKREDLRFVVGENVQVVPSLELGSADYTDEVIVLGAGTGRSMIRGTWKGDRTRLRRPMVVTNKTVRTVPWANRVAATWGALVAPDTAGDVKQLVVRNSPNAPLGSWRVGDSLRLIGPVAGWSAGLDMWVRVLDIQISPDTGDVATMTVTRVERAQP